MELLSHGQKIVIFDVRKVLFRAASCWSSLCSQLSQSSATNQKIAHIQAMCDSLRSRISTDFPSKSKARSTPVAVHAPVQLLSTRTMAPKKAAAKRKSEDAPKEDVKVKKTKVTKILSKKDEVAPAAVAVQEPATGVEAKSAGTTLLVEARWGHT